MADTGEARDTARDAVVRPLSRAAVRPCARPGCPSPARATLSFRYDTREAWLGPLGDDPSPADYDLCSAHADRTRPPHGWAIVDRRPEDDQAADRPPGGLRDLGGEHTVAVLAAALRSVPAAPTHAEPVDAEPDVDVGGLEADEDGAAGTAVDDEIRDALAELQAVAQGDLGLDFGPSALAEDTPEVADDEAHDAVADADAAGGDSGDSGDSGDQHGSPPRPRPVPAARDRHREQPDGPARAW